MVYIFVANVWLVVVSNMFYYYIFDMCDLFNNIPLVSVLRDSPVF